MYGYIGVVDWGSMSHGVGRFPFNEHQSHDVSHVSPTAAAPESTHFGQKCRWARKRIHEEAEDDRPKGSILHDRFIAAWVSDQVGASCTPALLLGQALWF